LQENNRCLHLLSSRSTPMSDTAIHSLRIGVKRLRATWRLLEREIPASQFEDADARLRATHHLLAPSRDQLSLLATTRGLLEATTKPKTRAALVVVERMVRGRGRETVTRDILDRVSHGVQYESSVWRELDVARIDDGRLIDGFARSYRRGCRLGERALRRDDVALMHRWRRLTKYCCYQLDMIKPVLGADLREKRWYLDRLGDTLGRYHDLLLLRDRVVDAPLGRDDRARVEKAIDKQLAAYRKRARKLYPAGYAHKGHVYRDAVAADVARLSFDNVIVLPRSA
ncbi:MAG TPA: CHAD domain-containing protein, partial [Pseudomonadales bacterium]